MKQLHPIQLGVLTKLLFAPELSYSEIKPSDEIGGNQFSFHLHQLEDFGYVIKIGDRRSLTLEGKEYANRISDESQKIEKQPKVSVLLGCTRDGVDGLELLIYTRLKHPFYGKQGLFGGKIKYGETVQQAAERELYEETGYTGMAQLIGIKHYLVYHADSRKLLEDKYLRLCCVHNPSGEFAPCDEGYYQRIRESELCIKVTDYFNSDDFEELIQWTKLGSLLQGVRISEVTQYTTEF